MRCRAAGADRGPGWEASDCNTAAIALLAPLVVSTVCIREQDHPST